jgi:hypothetical protein
MKNKIGAALAGLVAVCSFMAAQVAVAYATADSTAVSTVGDGALTLKDTLIAIATTVLPYAAAVAAIVVGWRMARKFVHA